LRTDVAVVDVNLVRRSWYVDGYLRATYPELMDRCSAQADAFLARLRDWEHGRPHDPEELTRLFTDLHNRMIAARLATGEVHLTVPMEPGIGQGLVWIPHGLTMRLAPPGARPRLEPQPELHTAALTADGDVLHEVVRTKVRPYYALMLANRGRLLVLAGDLEGARRTLDEALRLEPDSSPAHQAVGDLERALGRPDRARSSYERALRLDPANELARRGLAALVGERNGL
jgi:tetratricopeptide (TPR) repeat protein